MDDDRTVLGVDDAHLVEVAVAIGADQHRHSFLEVLGADRVVEGMNDRLLVDLVPVRAGSDRRTVHSHKLACRVKSRPPPLGQDLCAQLDALVADSKVRRPASNQPLDLVLVLAAERAAQRRRRLLDTRGLRSRHEANGTVLLAPTVTFLSINVTI